jgi:hypothetical protein
VHNFSASSQAEALRFGVTTQLDMFTEVAQLEAFKRSRTSPENAELADVFSAGTLVTAPNGHGTQYGLQIPTLAPGADAATFVSARVSEGSDFIKLVLEDGSAFNGPGRFTSLDDASLRAAIKAAHDNKRIAVVHVTTEAAAISALEAGADGLAHSFFDKVASDRFIELARKKKAFMVATLSVHATIAGSNAAKSLVTDPDLKPFVLPTQADQLTATFPGMPVIATALPNPTATVRKLDGAGVTVLAGTDAPNPGTTYGVSMHGELELLVAAGLTPVEALRAATSAPAKAFRLTDRGVIAPGKRADLLLVEGDPTTRIQATRRIAGIWKNGHAVRRDPTPAPVPSAAPVAPPGFPISDFESGTASAQFGSWSVTTDAIRGGKSVASMDVIDGGAEKSVKALRITGTVAEGPMGWAGVLFNPGQAPFAPVNFSGRTHVSFWIRGDGRTYAAMLFSGESAQGAPSVRTVNTTKDTWQQVRIPLDQFSGADISRVRAVAIVAGAPAGQFETTIDSFGLE